MSDGKAVAFWQPIKHAHALHKSGTWIKETLALAEATPKHQCNTSLAWVYGIMVTTLGFRWWEPWFEPQPRHQTSFLSYHYFFLSFCVSSVESLTCSRGIHGYPLLDSKCALTLNSSKQDGPAGPANEPVNILRMTTTPILSQGSLIQQCWKTSTFHDWVLHGIDNNIFPHCR